MTMKQLILIASVILLFQSCTPKAINDEDVQKDTLITSIVIKETEEVPEAVIEEKPISQRIARDYFVSTKYDSSNTEFVNEKLAVMFYPNDSVISKLQKEWGEGLYTVADDNSYYTYELGILLDSLKIKTIHSNKRLFVFKGAYEDYIMDLNGIAGHSDSIYWDVVLFNASGEPVFVDYVIPEIERIKNYMGIE